MKKILLIGIIFFISFNTSFASNSQRSIINELSTVELNAYIKELESQQKNIIKSKSNISKEYGTLISFIKKDLSKQEIDAIQAKLEVYINQRDIIQNDLNTKISRLLNVEQEKKNLLLLKADMFVYLGWYIDVSKRNEFNQYIKAQIQSEQDANDIIEQIKKSQRILDQKLEYYQLQVEAHKEELQNRIDGSITQKIRQRVEEIDTNTKYKDISIEIKNQIYKDFIAQLQISIKEIQISNLSQNYKDLRTNILQKMIDEIQLRIK